VEPVPLRGQLKIAEKIRKSGRCDWGFYFPGRALRPRRANKAKPRDRLPTQAKVGVFEEKTAHVQFPPDYF